MLLAPSLDRIEFVIVPDITVPGAFDNVLDGVKYIQHIASPLPKPVRFSTQRTMQLQNELNLSRLRHQNRTSSSRRSEGQPVFCSRR